MATPETEVTTGEEVNVLKRKSDDVGWEYGVLVDPKNKDKVKCLLCGHVSSAGINRLKQHVAHVGTSVIKCKKSSEEAKEKLTKAKREIKQSFGNMEARYKDVMAIVDKKMKGRLDSPLHLAAYLVNPHYSYADTSIFDDGTVIEGFITCVETFYHGDEDMQDQVVNTELRLFQTKKGSFAKKLARTYQNFDYNPASWWRLYGTETPGLQRLAVRILSLTSSSSGCERNWSIFEQIHTKRRNRLTTERLNLLVFIQFNSKLMSKREKIKSKKISDVLVCNETTEAQGFLFEGGDDCAMVIYRDEEDEEMADTNMPWSVIGEAMGVDDQFEQRRSARMRDLYVEEEFESEEEDFAEDQDLMCD